MTSSMNAPSSSINAPFVRSSTRTLTSRSTVVSADGLVRKVCKFGTSCYQKNPKHTEELSHPYDDDYLVCCRCAGQVPEFISVLTLFKWCDERDAGKATKEEVGKVWPLIQEMGSGIGDLDAVWEAMDDDGNGYVNFSEFAEFTTSHNVGLPLGLDSLIGKSGAAQMRCGVHGCNCTDFCEARRRCKYAEKCYQRKEEHVMSFCHPGDPDWDAATGRSDVEMCKCGHKKRLHASSMVAAGAVPYPPYWTTEHSGDEEFNALLPVNVGDLEKFQRLLNITYSDVTTRDRVRHSKSWEVPRNFVLESVDRNENSKLWRKYIIRKAELQNAKASNDGGYHQYDDVKTTKVVHDIFEADDSGVVGGVAVDKAINEWYLFHGTSASAARNICMNDFKMRLAGSATGTLYGKGSYMAESITKADEYSKEEKGCFTVLLCRVLGGNVMYTDDRTPDPDELTKQCVEGPYDCILGDREKLSGTYREFIMFDSENVYPEFVLKYRRGEFFKSASHPEEMKKAAAAKAAGEVYVRPEATVAAGSGYPAPVATLAAPPPKFCGKCGAQAMSSGADPPKFCGKCGNPV